MSESSPLTGKRSTILVRDAREADMAAVCRIYGHHAEHGLASFEETAPTLDELLARRAEVTRRGLPYLVAERCGGIVGFAYASPYRTRSSYRYAVEDSVYVDHAALRQGIGRALLGALIARCTALGYRQMVAVIGDSANEGSLGAHAALGFSTIGCLPAIGFKRGRWVDCVLMQRALGPGSTAPPERP
ncbi:MAG: GNAT family N-acetyltransferase [Alphaproteobacteria bacterium]